MEERGGGMTDGPGGSRKAGGWRMEDELADQEVGEDGQWANDARAAWRLCMS